MCSIPNETKNAIRIILEDISSKLCELFADDSCYDFDIIAEYCDETINDRI